MEVITYPLTILHAGLDNQDRKGGGDSSDSSKQSFFISSTPCRGLWPLWLGHKDWLVLFIDIAHQRKLCEPITESPESPGPWSTSVRSSWWHIDLDIGTGRLVMGDGWRRGFRWWRRTLVSCIITVGLILGLHPTNERRRYNITRSLIGWAQT